jgi:hypothetical protein
MPDEPKLLPQTPDQLISLLGVYASQYASYTALMWQVPALSLTAQAFLLTLALGHANGTSPKLSGRRFPPTALGVRRDGPGCNHESYAS